MAGCTAGDSITLVDPAPPTLILYIDPSDSTTINPDAQPPPPSVGDPIEKISDLSTFNNDVTQPTPGQRPSWETDAIRFVDANNDWLLSASTDFNLTGSFTFAVWAKSTTTALQEILGKNNFGGSGNMGYAILGQGS